MGKSFYFAMTLKDMRHASRKKLNTTLKCNQSSVTAISAKQGHLEVLSTCIEVYSISTIIHI